MRITAKQRSYLQTLLAVHPEAYAACVGELPSSIQTKSQASLYIDAICNYLVYRPLTQRARIVELLKANDMRIGPTWVAMEPQIGSRPLVWSTNANGMRIPKPQNEQRIEARQTLIEVLRELRNQSGGNAESSGEYSDDDYAAMESESQDSQDGSEGSEDEQEGSEESESESEQEMTPEEQAEADAKTFLAFIRKARKYWESRAADGITESIGMRPALNGAKMIRAGIPAQAAIHAMAMHWPHEARETLKVQEYDPMTFRQDTVEELSSQIGEQVHRMLPYLLALAEARIPICLIGTHGTGKTELARQLCLVLYGTTDRFGFASMTEGTPPSTFYGRSFPEFVESQWQKVYRDGGVYLFDEMDAAHPNLLLIVNAALANGHFSNVVTGDLVPRSDDTVFVSAMNTTGMGADRNYVGRKRLDAAALDRWHMGRVKVPIDEDLEESLYSGILS